MDGILYSLPQTRLQRRHQPLLKHLLEREVECLDQLVLPDVHVALTDVVKCDQAHLVAVQHVDTSK